jgi:4-hydroxy-4-methyl-2-oxoglutarate aldolase
MSVLSDNMAALSELSTPTISDAVDRLGIAAQASGIARITGTGTVVGIAFTVQYVPVGTSGGTVGDFIDDLEAGSFVVLNNNGRTDATVWGGLLSEVAIKRGVVATAIDGVCRDTPRASELGYSLFARSNWMRTGKDRVRAERVQVPVALGDLLVRPGDVIVGDADGVLVLPLEHVSEILDTAVSIEQAEVAIRADTIDGGMRLDEARKLHQYHSLQSKAPSVPVDMP